ncbi:pyridoxine 5'-phosphate synthase [Tistrella bauzanensis]|nr:pyridoxine 5'-phosphate synthase [Tistrella bauzanensis]
MTTKLSVNLNKVALLRNQRDNGYPCVVTTARRVLRAGAHGITIHPRPDQRHIRLGDVDDLAALFASDLPEVIGAEFNIEGYPSEDFAALVNRVRPHQVTLVPDAPGARTSEEGWDFDTRGDELAHGLALVRPSGARIAAFINPDPAAPSKARRLGLDRVEVYTGLYAMAWGTPAFDTTAAPHLAATAAAAEAAGIGMNAGHDLNLANLGDFLHRAPNCLEVSIGHAITAEALDLGWDETVRRYLDILNAG